VGLEPTVTELAAGVDKLQRYLLKGSLLGVRQQRLKLKRTSQWNTMALNCPHLGVGQNCEIRSGPICIFEPDPDHGPTRQVPYPFQPMKA
jgi:hypothetical protein